MRKFLVATLIAGFGSSCMAKEIDGMTSKDIFDDTSTRALADAACNGKTSKIKKHLSSDANINDVGFQGTTPLLWALFCENIKGVDFLLQNGADPNHKADKNISAVTIAATYDDPKFLKAVLEAGGDPNAEHQNTTGDGSALKLAFKNAIYSDDWSKFELLLEKGADINRPSSDGQGIARYALIWGRYCKILEMFERDYSYKLPNLLISSHTRQVDEGSESHSCRSEVIEYLQKIIDPIEYNILLDNIEERTGIKPTHLERMPVK